MAISIRARSCVALFSIVVANLASAQSAPTLGTASSFAVLAGQKVTNIGATSVSGNVGVSPGIAMTGFPPGTISNGTMHLGDAVAAQGQADLTTAYNSLAGQACLTDLTGQDLGGLTLTPGVYCFSSSAALTGTLTLDANGNSGAVFVFQIVSTLITATNAQVNVINGGNGCNAYWQVGSSATLGTGTSFAGNILALTSVTMDNGSSASGRVLAQNGTVTMQSNSAAACSAVTPVTLQSFGVD